MSLDCVVGLRFVEFNDKGQVSVLVGVGKARDFKKRR